MGKGYGEKGAGGGGDMVLVGRLQVGFKIKNPVSERTHRAAEPSLEFISTVNIACK